MVNKVYRAVAPNGEEIVGTYEMVPGVAEISSWWRTEKGELEFEHGGYTRMFWDGAETQVVKDGPKKGMTIFLCAAGEEWTEDQITLEEVE